jgi:hypothetical protein
MRIDTRRAEVAQELYDAVHRQNHPEKPAHDDPYPASEPESLITGRKDRQAPAKSGYARQDDAEANSA